jgi:hypothetical protein
MSGPYDDEQDSPDQRPMGAPDDETLGIEGPAAATPRAPSAGAPSGAAANLLPPRPPAPTPRSVPAAPVFGGSLKDGELINPMELGDFMMQLGMLFRLPVRVKEPEPGDQPGTSAKRRSRRSLLIRMSPILAAVLVSTYAAFNVTLPSAQTATVPEELIGVWITSDAKYAGRHLALTDKTVVIGKGDAGESGHTVKTVDQRAKGDTTIYTIIYQDEGGTRDLVLRYLPGGKPRVTLLNQPQMIWRRVAKTTTEYTGMGGAAAFRE